MCHTLLCWKRPKELLALATRSSTSFVIVASLDITLLDIGKLFHRDEWVAVERNLGRAVYCMGRTLVRRGEERRGVLYDRSAWPGKAFGFQYHSRQTIFYSSSSRGRLPSQQLPGKWFSAVSIGAQDLFCGKAVPPFVCLFQSSSSNSISPASSLLV